MTPEHSTSLATTEDDALLHPIPNPGIEHHAERYTDVDAKAADRAYKQVVGIFGLVPLLAIAFVVIYFAVPRHATANLLGVNWHVHTTLLGLTGGDGVEVYDVAGGKAPQLVKKIATGKGAHAFRAVGDVRHVFVSNRVANTISKIDYVDFKAVDTFPAPSGPDCMDISADGSLIMVGSRWAGKLTLIDVAKRKVVHQVKVGKSPHGVWTLDHARRQ